MSNWKRITEQNLVAALSRHEVDAYRSDFEVDTVNLLIADVVAEVRDHVASNGNVRMDPDEATVPASCVSKALDILVLRVLKRINVQPVQVRIDAARAAEEFLARIAEGKITPQGYDAGSTEPTGGACAVVIRNARERVSAAKLEGL